MYAKKTVWHLCSNRWNSAITEYALSAAQALHLCAWQSVYSGLKDSPGSQRARALRLPGIDFTGFGLGQLGMLRSEALRLRPDVILLYGGPETFASRFLPAGQRWRFRGQDRDVSEPLSRIATRWSLGHCRGVITPSRLVQERFAVHLSKPVHSVPLGLDAGRFQFVAPAWAAARSRPTLRIIGRLDPIKGHREFFPLYRRMLEIWPASAPLPWLEIVGQEANLKAEDLRHAAYAAGLKEQRDWALRIERVADLPALMSGTHLGVISSLGSEVICRVAEEFLLCGSPVAVSGVGSLAEVLFSPEAGTSYRIGDESAQARLLVESLWSAFAEPQEPRKLRAQAARQHFSLERMGEALEHILLTPSKSGKGP
jgi:glycosyltransferase involved in cell wall biosynthesis